MKSLKWLAAALLIGTFTSCNKGGFKKNDNGLQYKVLVDKPGELVKEGEVMTLNMVYKRAADDSLLFDTYKTKAPIRIALQKPTFKGGLEEGFAMMSPGDSMMFKVPADSVFLKTFKANAMPPFIKAGSELVFTVKLEKIQSRKEVEAEYQAQQEQMMKEMEQYKVQEPGMIADFVKKNGFSAKPIDNGIYTKVQKQGSGKSPVDGKVVVVNYVGRFFNGKLFDTSVEEEAKKGEVYNPQRKYNPFEFTLGTKSVIPGWETAIKSMKPGEKTTFIIPSNMAYGPEGAGPIPPYTPLMFDIELLQVK